MGIKIHNHYITDGYELSRKEVLSLKALKVQRNDNKTEVTLWKISDTFYKVKFDNPYASIMSSYKTLEEAQESFEWYCAKALEY